MFSSVCRVCLISNVKMYCIQTAGFQEIYEKVAGTKLNSGGERPATICYICCSQLRRCQRFSEMSRKAENMFTNLIKNGLEATQMVNKNIRIQHNLTSITLHSISLNTSIVSLEKIKTEPESDEEISINDKAHEYGMIYNTKETHLIKEDPETIGLFEEGTSVPRSHNIKIIEELSPSKTTEQAILEPKTHLNKCHVCDQTFTLKIALNAHLKCHSTSEQYSCKKCQKYYYCKINLEKHKCIKKPDTNQLTELSKPDIKTPFYSCSKCTKIFRYKRNLKQHIKVLHSGFKPFICEICGKSFKRSYCLKIHKKIHGYVYPFECDTCSKRFLLKPALAKHIVVHTGQRPYSCHICTSSFKQVHHLKRHLTSHSTDKPFECDKCNTKFTRKDHLVRHQIHICVA